MGSAIAATPAVATVLLSCRTFLQVQPSDKLLGLAKHTGEPLRQLQIWDLVLLAPVSARSASRLARVAWTVIIVRGLAEAVAA